MKKYTYNLTDFLNGIVDIARLSKEINESDITIALSYINIQTTFCEIVFKDDLATDEINELTYIVNNHTGEKLIINDTLYTKIKEEEYEGKTQGNFQSIVIDLETEGNEIVQKDISFPYPISLFSAEWLTDTEHKGDRAEFHVGPDTIIGEVTVTADQDSTATLYVSSTVIKNIKKGFYIKIGSKDNESLGQVINYDIINNTITLDKNLLYTCNAGDYVYLTVKVVPYWRFTSPGFSSVGENKIGASYIPENTILRLIYYNENGITTKKLFGISIDYLY